MLCSGLLYFYHLYTEAIRRKWGPIIHTTYSKQYFEKNIIKFL